MNQPPLQRRKVRQTLPNLMLFGTPNQTCQKTAECPTKPIFEKNAKTNSEVFFVLEGIAAS